MGKLQNGKATGKNAVTGKISEGFKLVMVLPGCRILIGCGSRTWNFSEGFKLE